MVNYSISEDEYESNEDEEPSTEKVDFVLPTSEENEFDHDGDASLTGKVDFVDQNEFELDGDTSIVWSVSDESDSDDESNESHETETNTLDTTEVPVIDSIETETGLLNTRDVSRLLQYSSESESEPSPKQNRDLLTPPSQPSSAPSSPPSAPSSPAPGPRTPRMNSTTPSTPGSRTTLRTPADGSPFRRPALVTTDVQVDNHDGASSIPPGPDPVNVSAAVSMRGALTHRSEHNIFTQIKVI